MPENRSLKHVLAEAEEKEERYDWLFAVQSYNEAQRIVIKQKDFLQAGEFLERIGFCFYRAAMQAESQDEFTQKIQEAIKAYKKARRFYEKLSPQKATRKFRCDAFANYLGYWLASDPSEKRQFLDDCIDLEEKALTDSLKRKDMQEYRRTYCQLPLVFFLRAFLESDRQTLRRILERGLEWGEPAIAEPSKSSDLSKTARVYLTLAICLSDAGFYLTAESEDIDKNRLEAVKYLNKAAELAEKIDDALLLGLSHLWLGINSGEEEAVRHHEKALECGKQTRDNFLIANSLDYLAYDMHWKALATEDPEKRRELAETGKQFYREAQQHYHIISFMSPRGGFIGPPSGEAEHYYQLAQWETDPERRLELLEKSEKLGVEALESAEESDMPLVIAQVFHVVSKTLQAQARLEPNSERKKDRLEKALEYREKTIEIFTRLTPFFYWNLGVMQNYLAGIKAELADIEPDLEKKKKLLEESALSEKKCLELCNEVMPSFERKGETALFAALHTYQDTYVTLLTRLYNITGKAENLRRAIEVLRQATESARKIDMVSLVAESYWEIAKAQDILGEHTRAAKNFEQASESYTKAAEKIPQLKGFYQDHASYMQAWSEIEKARIQHMQMRYGQAKEHYEKAADLHESTERWNYLSSNYLAWARLEEAEDLSRREQIQKAIKMFQKAAELFHRSEGTLRVAERRIENLDEKDLASRLVKASAIREEYCLGRTALEEAKLLGRQGDNAGSFRKYGMAAKRFQKTFDMIEHESSFTKATITKDRHELMPIIYLCRAWQMMKKAEAEASPELYLKASKLFNEAKENSLNENARLLALGHSYFCKALEAGTRFEDSRDRKFYLSATQHLESAANYYVRAGFEVASKYAIATQRLFDAYVYMANAKKETDPGKKARYYLVAEKVLQISIGSYLEAKHPAKSEQVKRLLEKVREERELAMSLSEILDVPTITSSTVSFATPTPSEEAAVGLERFDRANIQANLILPVKDLPVGEDLNIEMQIVNAGKEPVLLAQIREILPQGFELVKKPSYSQFEDRYLNMRGKQLGPLKTEEVKLVAKPFSEGTFEVKPEIIYVDKNGEQMVSELEPVRINVSRVVLPDRVATGFEGLDNLLFGGIPENYAVILNSPSCDERDLLIKKFLDVGAKEGRITFYVTTKAIPTENLTKAPKLNFFFICNPQADKTIESLRNAFKLKGVENLTDINIALTSALRKLNTSIKGPRRCCIEIISDVLLQHKTLHTRKWLTSLLQELKSNNFTILSVMDAGMHSAQEVRAITDLFDGEINMYERRGEKKTENFLRIKRMAGQRYLESEMLISKEKLQA